MKKLLIILMVLTYSLRNYAQIGVEAGPDQVSVCGSSITLVPGVYKGWAMMPLNGIVPQPFSCVKFISEDVGFICGTSNVYKTVDKAWNWNPVYSSNSALFNTIYFRDNLNGFIGGTAGVILKTTNGGSSWTSITTDGSTSFQSIWFSTEKTGFAVGNAGAIFKTTDGGSSWTKTVVDATTNYYSVVFTSAATGFIGGSNSVLLKTTDGGVSWTSNTLNSVKSTLYSMSFITPQVGYISGTVGSIYKTSDGGETWKMYIADSLFTEESPALKGKLLKSMVFKSVCFASTDTGYIAGYTASNSVYAKTTDGGQHWFELNSDLKSKANALTIVGKPNVGYAVTSLGRVLKYYEKLTPSMSSNFHWTSYGDNSFISRGDTAIVSPTQDQIYFVRGIGEYGTEISDSVTVHVQNLQVSSTPKYTQALGGTVKIDNYKTNYTGTDKFSYKWSPATGLSSDTAQFPILTLTSKSAQYNLTVTTPLGCTASCTVTVKDSLVLQAMALNDVVCNGNVRLGYTTNYSGSGKLRYKWTPATGLNNDTIANPVATIFSSTKYTLTITTPDGKTASSEVTAKVLPLTVNAGTDKLIKCGNPTTLTGSTNYSSNTIKYKWTPSTGLSNDTIYNPVATPSGTTTYRLTATTPYGCSSYDDILITVAAYTVNAGVDKTVIAGSSVKMDSVTVTSVNSNLKYKWTPSTGLNRDSIPNPVASPCATTTYRVTVTTPQGCSYFDDVIVTVTPLTINLGADKTMNCGSNVQLGVATSSSAIPAGSKYKWTPSSGLSNDTIPNPVAKPSVNTTYTLTLTLPNGCTISDDVKVSVVAMNKPSISKVEISADNKNVIYWEASTSGKVTSYHIFKETNVTDNYTQLGSVDATSTLIFKDTLSHPDIQSNKYRISLVDECGFESDMSVYHKTMHLTINKGVGTIWNLIWEPYQGFTVATYNIYRGTSKQNIQIIGSLSGSNTQFSDYSAAAGDVYYQVEAVGTTASAVKSQQIKQNNAAMQQASVTSRSNIATNYVDANGLNNPFGSDLISVYPNPASTEITVSLATQAVKTYINIYNAMGQQVATHEVFDAKQKINISNLHKGMYLIEVRNETQSGVTRLLVE
ncbi:MAG: hypothetical protein RIS29_1476 [Bacteroidota bacterium]|jgi:photosystem II stability/assembly factor-like uncharacterized protein